MATWLKVVIGIIVAFILIGLFMPKDETKTESTTTTTENTDPSNTTTEQPAPAAPETLKVTAKTLSDDYEANEVNADNLYKGKTLEVSGTVESINKDFADDVYLILEGNPNTFTSLHVYLSDKEAAAKLSKGQKITVIGEGGGMIVGTPVIRNGYLKNPEQNPEQSHK